MTNIVELTEDNFETEVIQAAAPVVVDFCAPWCGPCNFGAVFGALLANRIH
jgi:thioredoxin 1